MSIEVRCPFCGFSRSVAAERVPAGPARVTCPKCRQSFSFTAADRTDSGTAAGVAPQNLDETEASLAAEPGYGPGLEPLRGIGELFREAWTVYLRRIGVLMSLYLLSLAMLLGPMAVLGLGGGALALIVPDLAVPLLVAGLGTGAAVGALAMFWGMGALVAATVDERLDVAAALKLGWNRFWGFLWVAGLGLYLITGGFFLCLVPGFFFLIWFSLAQYIFFAEGAGGMSAMLRSKSYVRGRFGEVALRLLAVWGLSLLLGAVPAVGALLSLLFFPYLLIFVQLLYEDLRRIKSELHFEPAASEKWLWIGVATLGYLLLPVLLLFTWGGVMVATLAERFPF